MESSDNVCLVCHEAIEIFAIGRCDHPICFKCSTRMRALCDHFYCPICRTDLPEVFFLWTKEKFNEMPMRKFILNRKLKIQFENEHIREKFEQLLEHKCTLCPNRYPEKSFKALRDHMRRAHTLFYCDLCLELKIFASERKVYNRHDLALHRRVGDKDDKSYKGHPLCQFCELRYLDKDELYKHLRKDHFYCHFCESLGSQEFYDDYPVLREHFRTDHYLCEEGDCVNAQFTNAFRSDIDFKSHQAQQHSKAQTKQQARQERTLNIDINLVPRPSSRPQRGGRDFRGDDYGDGYRGAPRHQGSRGGKSNRYNSDGPNYREKQDLDRAIQASLSTMKDEEMKKVKPQTESNSKKETFTHNEENFPTLGGVPQTSVPVSTTNSVLTTSSDSKMSLADRFAMASNKSVQHGSLNDFPTLPQTETVQRTASPKNVPTPKGRGVNYKAGFNAKNDEEFPGLPSSSKPKSGASNVSGQWIKSEKVAKDNRKNQPQRSSPINQPLMPSAYDVNDFPSLGAPSKTHSDGTWIKSNKVISNKVSSSSNVSVNITDENVNSVKDVLDRFSPVNVPDSPKIDKNKQKKKKKKDKVSTIKADSKSDSPSLKGNASLDDIASLLLANGRDEEIEETHTNNSSIVEKSSEKSKPKKKIDKIEKKMEIEKEESKNEEIVIAENDEVVIPRLAKFAIAEEEFPALGPAIKTKAPPPGFKHEVNVPASQAPPGFIKLASKNIPPGFGTQGATEVLLNGSATGQDFMPIPAEVESFKYAQPDGFQERNQLLIGAIQAVCNDEDFSNFKTLSGEFRRDEINASRYYYKCQEILGKENFMDIFPELLTLLPEIDKQQELLTVFTKAECMKSDSKVSKTGKVPKNASGAWSPSLTGFLTCPTCRQVLLRKDYNSHISSHDLNTDFPSLSGSSVQNQNLGGGAWVRAK